MNSTVGRIRALTACAVVALVAATAGCGTDEPSTLDSTQALKAASVTATESPSASNPSTESPESSPSASVSARPVAPESSTRAKNPIPSVRAVPAATGGGGGPSATQPVKRGSLSAADRTLLQGLAAFERQVQVMVATKADREVSSEFSTMVGTVSSHASSHLTALDKAAEATGESTQGLSPAGLLPADVVSSLGTPSGDEFESAWKLVTLRQRKAALQFCGSAQPVNPLVKAAVDQVKTNIASQVSLLSA